ncbi:MAG: dihydropteroate synthase [Pseudomonadota bacterium]
MNDKITSLAISSDKRDIPTTTPSPQISTPKLVGILNFTPDSFSDGGQNYNIEQALQQSLKMIADGANIIELGAESTRPGAIKLTAEQEFQRLKIILPELIQLCKEKNILISLDSYHLANIKWALELGIDIVNDVSGLNDLGLLDVIENSNCQLVIMHNLGIPADKNNILPENIDIIDYLINWATNIVEKLESFNITKERLIIDPGIGFGKSPAQNIQILQNISALKSLGLAIMIGHSRKSFLTALLPNLTNNRDVETAYISSYLSKQKIDYLRVHNILYTHNLLELQKII